MECKALRRTRAACVSSRVAHTLKNPSAVLTGDRRFRQGEYAESGLVGIATDVLDIDNMSEGVLCVKNDCYCGARAGSFRGGALDPRRLQ